LYQSKLEDIGSAKKPKDESMTAWQNIQNMQMMNEQIQTQMAQMS